MSRYLEVMDAWFSAMEKRLEAGQPIDRIAAVASFFVSRVDSAVDQRLDARISDGDAGAAELKGKIAIANARLAYQAFEERFQTPRYAALAEAGAQVQRPLWASTSTSIGPDTVNTLPPKTLEAYRDHGEPKVRIFDARPEAAEMIDSLSERGIDFGNVTDELEVEGVKKFAASYEQLLNTIRKEQRLVQPT